MEDIAVSRGFEIVYPEELSFPKQAALFRSADCIVGEHGSGLHASVFANPGTIVASVGFNWVQCHVNAAFEQRLISMDRIQILSEDHSETSKFSASRSGFTVDEKDLIGLFDVIERVAQARASNDAKFIL